MNSFCHKHYGMRLNISINDMCNLNDDYFFCSSQDIEYKIVKEEVLDLALKTHTHRNKLKSLYFKFFFAII